MSRYLITFDMDTECLQNNYHVDSYNNAYRDIERVMKKYDFHRLQGSVYLGTEAVSEAHGTLALQELTLQFKWFSPCISNIKFYRLESDLDAQFIVDGVEKAKRAFMQRLEELRQNLLAAGLSEEQIQQILAKQELQLPNPK